jgi:hypothetical protein
MDENGWLYRQDGTRGPHVTGYDISYQSPSEILERSVAEFEKDYPERMKKLLAGGEGQAVV